MLRLLSFSLLVLFGLSTHAQDEELYLMGKVKYQEEKRGVEIEQRLVVEVVEQYLGEKLTLPLVDLRLFRGINDNLVSFDSEDKVFFNASKQGDGSYRVIEFIKYPEDYVFSIALDRTYKHVFLDKMTKELQKQIDKHDYFHDGKMDFMHYENNDGHHLQFYHVGLPVYNYSAIRAYLQRGFETFSQYYHFQRKEQYRQLHQHLPNSA